MGDLVAVVAVPCSSNRERGTYGGVRTHPRRITIDVPKSWIRRRPKPSSEPQPVKPSDGGKPKPRFRDYGKLTATIGERAIWKQVDRTSRD